MVWAEEEVRVLAHCDGEEVDDEPGEGEVGEAGAEEGVVGSRAEGAGAGGEGDAVEVDRDGGMGGGGGVMEGRMRDGGDGMVPAYAAEGGEKIGCPGEAGCEGGVGGEGLPVVSVVREGSSDAFVWGSSEILFFGGCPGSSYYSRCFPLRTSKEKIPQRPDDAPCGCTSDNIAHGLIGSRGGLHGADIEINADSGDKPAHTVQPWSFRVWDAEVKKREIEAADERPWYDEWFDLAGSEGRLESFSVLLLVEGGQAETFRAMTESGLGPGGIRGHPFNLSENGKSDATDNASSDSSRVAPKEIKPSQETKGKKFVTKKNGKKKSKSCRQLVHRLIAAIPAESPEKWLFV